MSWFRKIALRLVAAAFGGAHVALTLVDIFRLVALVAVVVYQLVDNVFSSFGRLHLEHHIFGGFADHLPVPFRRRGRFWGRFP
jgi:hypothetical protein